MRNFNEIVCNFVVTADVAGKRLGRTHVEVLAELSFGDTPMAIDWHDLKVVSVLRDGIQYTLRSVADFNPYAIDYTSVAKFLQDAGKEDLEAM